MGDGEGVFERESAVSVRESGRSAWSHGMLDGASSLAFTSPASTVEFMRVAVIVLDSRSNIVYK